MTKPPPSAKNWEVPPPVVNPSWFPEYLIFHTHMDLQCQQLLCLGVSFGEFRLQLGSLYLTNHSRSARPSPSWSFHISSPLSLPLSHLSSPSNPSLTLPLATRAIYFLLLPSKASALSLQPLRPLVSFFQRVWSFAKAFDFKQLLFSALKIPWGKTGKKPNYLLIWGNRKTEQNTKQLLKYHLPYLYVFILFSLLNWTCV